MSHVCMPLRALGFALGLMTSKKLDLPLYVEWCTSSDANKVVGPRPTGPVQNLSRLIAIYLYHTSIGK